MKSEIEEPIVTRGSRGETITKHPAFAHISSGRVSGHANLYGSDFTHQHYMTVKIYPSELHRDLSHDWYFGGGAPYIEVALSESQWATFVSEPNINHGPPCTLQYLNGVPVAKLPNPKPAADRYKMDVADDLKEGLLELYKLKTAIEQAGLSAKKASILSGMVDRVKSIFTGSVPFVAKSFDEHAEKTVEKAKQEIHGYMTGVIMRAGIKTLSEEPAPLLIEHGK